MQRVQRIFAEQSTIGIAALSMLLVIAAIRGLTGIIMLILQDVLAPYAGDTFIIAAVGRGILNGLMPYADLFDAKGPGSFLTAAFSLALFEDLTFFHILKIALIICFPLLTSFHLFQETRHLHRAWQWCYTLTGFLFGTLLALLASTWSQDARPDTLGTLPGVLYILSFVHTRGKPWSIGHQITAALLMMCAIGMIEPFAVALCAGALILSEDMKTMVQKFLMPLGLAAVIGILILAILGYLQPYVGIYLDYMLFTFIKRGDPLWLKGLFFEKYIPTLFSFSPFFGLGLMTMWIVTFFSYLRKREVLWHIARCFLFLYLIGVTVSIGNRDFSKTYFVMLVPALLALFLAAMRTSHTWKRGGSFFVISLLVAFSVFSTSFQPDYHAVAGSKEVTQVAQLSAEQIDRVMDGCGYDRYLHLGNTNAYGLTRHSPHGPIVYNYYFHGWVLSDYLRTSFQVNLKKALFIAEAPGHFDIYQGPLMKEITDELRENFTQVPPPCAKGMTVPRDTKFYYRI